MLGAPMRLRLVGSAGATHRHVGIPYQAIQDMQ